MSKKNSESSVLEYWWALSLILVPLGVACRYISFMTETAQTYALTIDVPWVVPIGVIWGVACLAFVKLL